MSDVFLSPEQQAEVDALAADFRARLEEKFCKPSSPATVDTVSKYVADMLTETTAPLAPPPFDVTVDGSKFIITPKARTDADLASWQRHYGDAVEIVRMDGDRIGVKTEPIRTFDVPLELWELLEGK